MSRRAHLSLSTLLTAFVLTLCILPSAGAVESVPPGTGTGLSASYFNNMDFTGGVVRRVDPVVDWTWGIGVAPVSEIEAKTYSVIWKGQIQALTTETYTIATLADDGVKVYIDGILAINNTSLNYDATVVRRHQTTRAFTAGDFHDIEVRYYQNRGTGRIALLWSTPTISEQVIPQSQLYVVPPAPAVFSPPGAGTGLRAQYFNNQTFTGGMIERVDPTVDFAWGTSAPAPEIDAGYYSVIWRGLLTPRSSETYTISTLADDSVEVLIDGVSVINQQSLNYDSTVIRRSGVPIAFVADSAHTIEVRYKQQRANATMRLLWSSPNLPEEVIPQSQLSVIPPTPVTFSPVGSGTGLQAQYYNNWDFTGGKIERIDPTVDFSWGSSAPASDIDAGYYAVIWRGKLRPRTTERYYLTTQADDGVEVLIDGYTVIQDQSLNYDATKVRRNSAPLDLEADVERTIEVRYYQQRANATMRLLWSSPNVPEEVIPQSQLYVIPPVLATLSPPGNGTGLHARYWNNQNFSGGMVERIDPTLNFTWPSGQSPAPDIEDSTFAITWEGKIRARSTERYTISTRTDDGVKVIIDGVTVINDSSLNYDTSKVRRNSVELDWTADSEHTVEIRYYQQRATGTMQLLWSTPTIAEEIIPQSQLLVIPPVLATLSPPSNGVGLCSTWFANADYTSQVAQHIDPVVDHTWGVGVEPKPGMGGTYYSVVWRGVLQARSSERYYLSTLSDDSVRLVINGQMVVDDQRNNYDSTVIRRNTVPLDFTADSQHTIEIWYKQDRATGRIALLWSTATIPEEVIPASQLFPPPSAVAQITWATPAPITYGAELTAAQLNATSGVAGTFSYSPAPGTLLPAGTHTLNVLFVPNNQTSCASASATVDLVVNPAMPVITWATPEPIVWGTPLDGRSRNAMTDILGTFTYAPEVGTILEVGTHPLTAVFTPEDTQNYLSVTTQVPLTVLPVPTTLTWLPPASITYNTPLSATQLNAIASAEGVISYSPSVAAILPAGIHTLTATFTPTDPHFATAQATVEITVFKATPVITWPTPPSITWGTALDGSQYNATANVLGEFSYPADIGYVPEVGDWEILTTFVPEDENNFEHVTASVTLVVLPVTPSISWPPVSTITFGTPLSASQLNATATVAGAFVYDPPLGMVLDAGIRTLAVTFTPTDAVHYTTAQAAIELTVIPAMPVITWNPPEDIVVGTPLSLAQLNASADVQGTFTYTPPLGTVLTEGIHPLAVVFQPLATQNYQNASASVNLTVQAEDPGTPPEVAFTEVSRSLPEQFETITVTVALSAASAQAVTVPFSVSGSALTSGRAVVARSPLVIPAGSTSATIAISLTDDGLPGDDTQLAIALQAPDHGVLGSITTWTLTIDEVNGTPQPHVAFAAAASELSEALPLGSGVEIVLDRPASEPVVVEWQRIGGDAPEADLTMESGVVSIPVGALSAILPVPIQDNPSLDGLRTIELQLAPQTGAASGSQIQTTVTVIDDEMPAMVQFASEESGGARAAKTLAVRVALDAPVQRTVIVPVAIAVGASTGRHGLDYLPLSAETVTIPAGADGVDVSIGLPGNVLPRGVSSATVVLDLGEPLGGEVLGGRVRHTYMICQTLPRPTILPAGGTLLAGHTATVMVIPTPLDATVWFTEGPIDETPAPVPGESGTQQLPLGGTITVSSSRTIRAVAAYGVGTADALVGEERTATFISVSPESYVPVVQLSGADGKVITSPACVEFTNGVCDGMGLSAQRTVLGATTQETVITVGQHLAYANIPLDSNPAKSVSVALQLTDAQGNTTTCPPTTYTWEVTDLGVSGDDLVIRANDSLLCTVSGGTPFKVTLGDSHEISGGSGGHVVATYQMPGVYVLKGWRWNGSAFEEAEERNVVVVGTSFVVNERIYAEKDIVRDWHPWSTPGAWGAELAYASGDDALLTVATGSGYQGADSLDLTGLKTSPPVHLLARAGTDGPIVASHPVQIFEVLHDAKVGMPLKTTVDWDDTVTTGDGYTGLVIRPALAGLEMRLSGAGIEIPDGQTYRSYVSDESPLITQVDEKSGVPMRLLPMTLKGGLEYILDLHAYRFPDDPEHEDFISVTEVEPHGVAVWDVRPEVVDTGDVFQFKLWAEDIYQWIIYEAQVQKVEWGPMPGPYHNLIQQHMQVGRTALQLNIDFDYEPWEWISQPGGGYLIEQHISYNWRNSGLEYLVFDRTYMDGGSWGVIGYEDYDPLHFEHTYDWDNGQSDTPQSEYNLSETVPMKIGVVVDGEGWSSGRAFQGALEEFVVLDEEGNPILDWDGNPMVYYDFVTDPVDEDIPQPIYDSSDDSTAQVFDPGRYVLQLPQGVPIPMGGGFGGDGEWEGQLVPQFIEFKVNGFIISGHVQSKTQYPRLTNVRSDFRSPIRVTAYGDAYTSKTVTITRDHLRVPFTTTSTGDLVEDAFFEDESLEKTEVSRSDARPYARFSVDDTVRLTVTDGEISATADIIRLTPGKGMPDGQNAAHELIPGHAWLDASSGNVHVSIPVERFATPLPGPDVAVSYNSMDRIPTNLGCGWRTNYDMRLYDDILVDGTGRRIRFLTGGVADPRSRWYGAKLYRKLDSTPEGLPANTPVAPADVTWTGDENVLLVGNDNALRFFTNGYLTRIRSVQGHELTITVNTLGATQVADKAGRSVTLTGLLEGDALQPTSLEHGISGHWTFAYTDDGQLETVVLAPSAGEQGLSRTWTFTYDDQFRLESWERPSADAARTSTVEYENEYMQLLAKKSTISWYDGSTSVWEFDVARESWTKMKDRVGVWTERTHFGNDRLVATEVTGGVGLTTFTYHTTPSNIGNIATLTKVCTPTEELHQEFLWAVGSVHGTTITGLNVQVEQTTKNVDGVRGAGNAADLTSSWSYFTKGPQTGQVKTATNASLFTTYFTYTSSGFLSTRRDPDGAITTYSGHTAFGLPTKEQTVATGRQAVPVLMRTWKDNGKHGLLASITDRLGGTTTFVYDARQRVSEVTRPGNQTEKMYYDAQGRTTQHITPNNRVTTTTTYDLDGRVTLVTATEQPNVATVYTRTGTLVTATTTINGKAPSATVTDAAGRTTEVIEKRALVAEHADAPPASAPSDCTTAYAYNAINGRLDTVTDPEGRETSFEYDEAGNQVAVITPSGTSTTTRNNLGWVLAQTDADGRTTTTLYDRRGQTVMMTSPIGGVVEMGYDAMGRQTLQQDLSTGQSTSWSYDAGGAVATTTDHFGRTSRTTVTPGSQPRVTQQVDGAPHLTSTQVFDTRQMLASVKQPGAAATTLEMRDDGVPVTVTAPGRWAAKSAYSQTGRLLKSFYDPGNGSELEKTEIDYDPALFIPTATTTPDGLVQKPVYHPVTLAVVGSTDNVDATDANPQQQDANGTVEAVNRAGQTLRTRSATGQVTTFVYDTAGRLETQVTKPKTGENSTMPEVRVTYTYTPAGRPLTVTTTGGGGDSVRTTVYENNGQTVRVTDSALGLVSEVIHDAAGRVLESRGLNGAWTQNTYNEHGLIRHTRQHTGMVMITEFCADRPWLTWRIRTGQAITEDDESTLPIRKTFVYDDLDRVIRTVYPDDKHESYIYNVSTGSMWKRIGRDGTVTELEYDGANRLAAESTRRVDDSGAQHEVTRSYAYNRDGAGRQEIAQAETVTTQPAVGDPIVASTATVHKMDRRGRLAWQQVGDQEAQSFAYDRSNRQMSGPGGTIVRDGQGLPTSITQDGLTAQVIYDEQGRIEQEVLPNGVTRAYSYDGANRVSGIAETVNDGGSRSWTLTRDGRGRLTSQSEGGLDGSAMVRWYYDRHDQLLLERRIGQHAYSGVAAYDRQGNRTALRIGRGGTNNTNWSLPLSGLPTQQTAYDGIWTGDGTTLTTTDAAWMELSLGAQVGPYSAITVNPVPGTSAGLGWVETAGGWAAAVVERSTEGLVRLVFRREGDGTQPPPATAWTPGLTGALRIHVIRQPGNLGLERLVAQVDDSSGEARLRLNTALSLGLSLVARIHATGPASFTDLRWDTPTTVESRTAAYDGENRMVAETRITDGEMVVITHDHDDAGNIVATHRVRTAGGQTTEETTNYAYDAHNRLRRQVVGAYGATFQYAAGSRQRLKESHDDGTEVKLEWNGTNLRKRSVTGGVQAPSVTTWAWRGSVPLWTRRPEPVEQKTVVFSRDARGQIVGEVMKIPDIDYIERNNYARSMTLNAYGETIAELRQVVSGVPRVKEWLNASVTGGVRWRGEYFTPETGLYTMGARMYDPATSRFTQQDPIQAGENWWAYCGGDPVNRWDPSGLYWRFWKNSDNVLEWRWIDDGTPVPDSPNEFQKKWAEGELNKINDGVSDVKFYVDMFTVIRIGPNLRSNPIPGVDVPGQDIALIRLPNDRGGYSWFVNPKRPHAVNGSFEFEEIEPADQYLYGLLELENLSRGLPNAGSHELLIRSMGGSLVGHANIRGAATWMEESPDIYAVEQYRKEMDEQNLENIMLDMVGGSKPAPRPRRAQPGLSRFHYQKLWHDKRVKEIYGEDGVRDARRLVPEGGTPRTYDARMGGFDIEFKGDNFSRGPRTTERINSMKNQINKDILLRDAQQARPKWHFNHDPRTAPEMKKVLDMLDDNNIPWTHGHTP